MEKFLRLILEHLLTKSFEKVFERYEGTFEEFPARISHGKPQATKFLEKFPREFLKLRKTSEAIPGILEGFSKEIR